MYNIGDKIVYPMHGAGVIVGIEEREILDETRKYYILRLPVKDMEVMVPVEYADEVGVRDILTREDMDKVFEVLRSEEKIEMPKNWSRRYRFNMDRIKSGNIEEIARVVRALERSDTSKNLSTGERKLLNCAKQIIISEMVLVYEEDYEKIVEIVDDAILR
ncbi:transcriptional regulator, CarD family [Peptoniphilus asaccharolyticus DSM 20463]|uniref:Transcriptional regulator, CarD family n=1 Tax=Peptoniphilus asaccharolyticus DSM 20463 TaxID=573058 RepID=A0A1W1VAR5_PEPAS|nr:CarD family transcriptional regulator [Peptoniphilus asaccharolyticus]MBL7575685.1 CarD family transcriptional regulator [Peptoniphilus asaccharolyticus]SMB90567.1 transcriptional regulator, CarD family [Peptoniphilus asaccharolyticus DSM 20463]